MSLDIFQQILELIKKARRILIVCPKTWNIDCLGSALGLSQILNKLTKNNLIVCDNFHPTSKAAFLSGLNDIKPNLNGLRKLIITINTQDNKILDITHTDEKDQFKIFITPEHQDIQSTSITTNYSNYDFDLIITLNAQDLESLGELYNKNTNFFYRTPIINIDHQADNENYGQINLIGLKSLSISELIFKLITHWNQSLINDQVATNLLAGIYDKTWSFRNSRITPDTLGTAAQLINLGARREEIVYHLYQKKTLPSLKLWGKVLENLKQNEQQKIVWSTITRQDFLNTVTTEKHLDGLVEELISTAPKSDVILSLYELNPTTIGGTLYASLELNALTLLQKYQPLGSPREAKFILEDTTLTQAEQTIIGRLTSQIKLKS